MDQYPAWVDGVVVANAEEEAAVREGRAIFEVIHSAHPSGDPEKRAEERRIVGMRPKEIGKKTRR